MEVMVRAFTLAVAIAVALISGQALGQDLPASSCPGIIGRDDRVRIDDQGSPWVAIGHVNVGGYRRMGRCTGILVAPDIVITAAHCVMDPWKKAPYPLRDIHFLAGVRGAANKGHATAKCLRFPRGYAYVGPERIIPRRPAQQVPLRAFSQDAVAIVLAGKLAVAPASLAEGVTARPGLALVHAAYPADRRLVLSAHKNCQLLRADLTGALWFIDCDTHPASSGGPVFAQTDGGLKLAAIMLGAAGPSANVALPVSEWKDLVREAACP